MDVPSTSSEYAPSHSTFVDTVNEFYLKYGLSPVNDLTEITAPGLVSVYELILGDRLHGVIRDLVTKEDEIHNIQCVIDSLAKDFLHCDLSHITGTAIFEGDVTTIQYLMEIFIELESFLMEQISDETGSQSEGQTVDRDSLTRGTVTAISEVLREEGIGSPPTRDRETDTSVRSSDSQLPSSISGDLEQHQMESDLSMEELIRLGDKAALGHLEPSLKTNNLIGEASRGTQPVRTVSSGKQLDLGIPLSGDNRKTSPPSSLNSSTSTFSSAPWPEPPPPSSGPMDLESEFGTLGVRPRQDNLHFGRYSDLMGQDNGPVSIQQHKHTHHHYHQTVPLASGNQRIRPSLRESLPVTLTSANKVPSVGPSSQMPPDPTPYMPTTSKSHIPPTLKHTPLIASQPPKSKSWQPPPATSYMPPASTSQVPSTSVSTYKPSTSVIRPTSTSRQPSTSQVTSTSQMTSVSTYIPSTTVMPPTSLQSSTSISQMPPRTSLKKAPSSKPQMPQETRSSPVRSPPRQGPVVRDYPSREAFITLTPPRRKTSSRDTRYPRYMSLKTKGKEIGGDSPVKKQTSDTFKPTDPRGDRHPKSQSWDKEDISHYQKAADERSLHKNIYPKSRSFEEHGKRDSCVAGPSNARPKRKVAFHLEDSDDSDSDGQTAADLVEKLRRRRNYESYADSDSDISVHSDSIIDYDRSMSDPAEEPSDRSRLRTKGKRSPRSPVSGSILLERSPPRQKTARVRFEDVLDAQAKGTMGKIRRKVNKEKRLQDIEKKTLQFLYSAGLRELQRDLEEQGAKRKRLIKAQDREYKKKVLRKPQTSGKKPAKIYTSRLVPPASPDRSRQPGQKRKRVGSPSQTLRRQKRLTVGDDEVLPVLLSEFPFLHVSPETVHAMWSKQMQQVEQLTKDGLQQKGKHKLQKKVEDAERRHQLLMDIMKKELAHNQRMRDMKEKQEKKRILQRREREKRQVTARARRYYDEFRLQAQSRMVKRKTKEERIFKNLFDEALKIQKSRIAELRKYAKDKREEMAGQQEDEIESMENYYRDQFNLLAEALEKERHELQVRDQAQARVLEQMRRTMRRKMEAEIRDFQSQLYQDEDTVYFRQLDAERMKEKLRNAAYKTQI